MKGPRFITHIKRLNEVHGPMANFFASGVLRLGKKLGPILGQLPPSQRSDAPRLEAFFQLLPRSTREAAAVARHHDHRLKARACLQAEGDRPIRHALEVRHASFENAAFIALLRRHDIALVVADTAGKWPVMHDVIADFVDVRLPGDTGLYASGYTPEALQSWARRIRAWAAGGEPEEARRKAGRDVDAYFDNDVKTHAPFEAMTLAHALGLGPPAPGRMIPRTKRTETVRTSWPGWSRRARAGRILVQKT